MNAVGEKFAVTGISRVVIVHAPALNVFILVSAGGR